MSHSSPFFKTSKIRKRYKFSFRLFCIEAKNELEVKNFSQTYKIIRFLFLYRSPKIRFVFLWRLRNFASQIRLTTSHVLSVVTDKRPGKFIMSSEETATSVNFCQHFRTGEKMEEREGCEETKFFNNWKSDDYDNSLFLVIFVGWNLCIAFLLTVMDREGLLISEHWGEGKKIGLFW